MDDAVAVALENIAWSAHLAMGFRVKPSAAAVGMRSVRSQLRHRALMPPSGADRKSLFCFQRINGNS